MDPVQLKLQRLMYCAIINERFMFKVIVQFLST